MDERAIQGRFDQIHHRMVYHSITKGGGGYYSRLALVDCEQPVHARSIIAPKKIPLQTKQLAFEVEAKVRNIILSTLPKPGFSIGQKQIFKACHMMP